MNEKDTFELDQVLGKTHLSEVTDYLKEQADSMLVGNRPFGTYMKSIIKRNKIKLQDVFLWADITEGYGYKLLSEEKRTKQRDVILRLCYAAEFTLEETQRALRIYEMPQLYSIIPRDAILMVCFNERPGSVIDVNAFLRKHQMEPLRTSGIQE